MVSAPAASLLTLGSALSGVRAREQAGSAERVGVGHFGGRSFDGWHRHVTLASIAHAIRELAPSTSDAAPAATRRRPQRSGARGHGSL